MEAHHDDFVAILLRLHFDRLFGFCCDQSGGGAGNKKDVVELTDDNLTVPCWTVMMSGWWSSSPPGVDTAKGMCLATS